MRKVILGLAIVTLACGPAYQAAAESANERAAAQQIAENMKQSGQLRDYRVGVKYQEGTAWLMGSVTSPEQRKIAERIARQSDGVTRVVNKLEVADGASEQQYAQQEVQPASAPLPRQLGSRQQAAGNNMPLPYARTMQGNVQPTGYGQYEGGGMQPVAMSHVPSAVGQSVSYDNPQMPGYAWPSYAAYPNYAAVTYPQQYSPAAWPYIGPFYPYPQVPLGWRKVTLEWDDGWWFLDFKDCKDCH